MQDAGLYVRQNVCSCNYTADGEAGLRAGIHVVLLMKSRNRCKPVVEFRILRFGALLSKFFDNAIGCNFSIGYCNYDNKQKIAGCNKGYQ